MNDEFERVWNSDSANIYLSIPMDEKLLKEFCFMFFEAVQLSTKQEWISVEDKLPEFIIEHPEKTSNGFTMPRHKESDICLVFVDGNRTFSTLIWREDYPDETTWKMLGQSVTHWMPLPKPPLPEIPKP